MSDLHRDVEAFLAREAMLLNDNKWDDWNALFAEDGAYWMPAVPGQDSPKTHVSLIYETAALRAPRIARLKDGSGLSVEVTPRSVRHLSCLVVSGSADAPVARASVLMAEYAREEVKTFHATAAWHLQARASGFVIAMKRVDLINCDGMLPDILTYI